MDESRTLERRLNSSPFDFLRPAFGVGLYVAWWSGNEVLQQAKRLCFHVVGAKYVRTGDPDSSFEYYMRV